MEEIMELLLRVDFQATRLGVQGGLPFQNIEWYEFSAPDFDSGLPDARKIFYNRIPNDNQRAEHFCQGAVLMAKNVNESLRMVYLKLPKDKRR